MELHLEDLQRSKPLWRRRLFWQATLSLLFFLPFLLVGVLEVVYDPQGVS